jgi:DedD protein
VEPNEREPSYYEVALTNRQVMVGLVVALATIVIAFIAGIWIGRTSGQGSTPQQIAQANAPGGGPEKVEQLTFFGEKPVVQKPAGGDQEKAPAAAPTGSERSAASTSSTPPDSEAEKLRQTLEADADAHRAPGTESSAASSTPAPGTRVSRSEAKKERKALRATAPAAESQRASPTASAVVVPGVPISATDAAASDLWIQVYSSSNLSKAKALTSRLQKAGFKVRQLETEHDGATSYRVRVGPYPTRAGADNAATRLRREFRLDTWVTDSP